jgi:hypothetical protein
MAIAGKGLLLIGAASLALGGCSKADKSKAAAHAPTAVPTQALAANASPVPAAAMQSVDFGDDNSKYSRDGECDDPRFGGPGMTDTPVLDTDIKHDATDCRSAFSQGRLTYKSNYVPEDLGTDGYVDRGADHIIWGDDGGKSSRDGECNDKRFTGQGMTGTPLLNTDIKHDASDCRAAFEQGRLSLRE